ncbi:MAG: hypothetical protein AB7I36_18215 [Rhodospirillaceae bacterium]
MIKPQHPVGPAFERARNAEEAWRIQQIAALTDEQKREYKKRRIEEAGKLKEHRRQLEAQKQKKIETEKQKILSGRPEHNLNVPVAMRERARNLRAEAKAKVRVAIEMRASRERAQSAARERLDAYLKEAARQRLVQQKEQGRKDTAKLGKAFEKAKARVDGQQRQEQAKTSTAAPARQEFNKKASGQENQSLSRAFEKAKQRQDAQNQAQQTKTQQQSNPGRELR